MTETTSLVPASSGNLSRWSNASRRRLDAARAWQERDVETLQALVVAHLRLRFQGRPSQRTVYSYRRYAKMFFVWMWAHSPGMKVTHDLGHLLHTEVTNGAFTLSSAKPSDSTIACMISAFREASNAMRWCGLWDCDMFEHCKCKAPDRLTPKRRPFSPEEVLRLLAACRTPNDHIIVRLGLDAGLRLQEIIDLTWGDVNLDDHTIVVRNGKGGRQRTVYVGNSVLYGLLRDNASPDPSKRVARSVRETRVFSQAGLPWGMHRLRHTCARDLLALSGSLEAVQRHLGHASIAITQVYAQMHCSEYRKAVDRAHAETPSPTSPASQRAKPGDTDYVHVRPDTGDGAWHSSSTRTYERSASASDTQRPKPTSWA